MLYCSYLTLQTYCHLKFCFTSKKLKYEDLCFPNKCEQAKVISGKKILSSIINNTLHSLSTNGIGNNAFFYRNLVGLKICLILQCTRYVNSVERYKLAVTSKLPKNNHFFPEHIKQRWNLQLCIWVYITSGISMWVWKG